MFLRVHRGYLRKCFSQVTQYGRALCVVTTIYTGYLVFSTSTPIPIAITT